MMPGVTLSRRTMSYFFAALSALIAGEALMLAGFLQLSDRLPDLPSLLPAAGIVLSAGFMLVLWNLGCTLRPARPLQLPARFVAIGLISLALTVAFGVIFTLVLGQQTSSDPMPDIAGAALPLHVAAGIGGWLTLTSIGVSYRLLAMFMLAPELDGTRPKLVLALAVAALAVVVAIGLGAILSGASLFIPLLAGSLLGLASLAVYGADIRHLYHARKRRTIELNSRMAIYALASLGAAIALAIGLAILGWQEAGIGAVVFVLVFGWLSGLGLANLYKIVAFLTWLECYGPVLGKTAAPRVQDLVVETRARKWFRLYFLAVWSGTATLLTGQATGFRIAAALMLAATIGIVSELVRIRLLSDVAFRSTGPAAVPRPHLLLSWQPSNRCRCFMYWARRVSPTRQPSWPMATGRCGLRPRKRQHRPSLCPRPPGVMPPTGLNPIGISTTGNWNRPSRWSGSWLQSRPCSTARSCPRFCAASRCSCFPNLKNAAINGAAASSPTERPTGSWSALPAIENRWLSRTGGPAFMEL